MEEQEEKEEEEGEESCVIFTTIHGFQILMQN